MEQKGLLRPGLHQVEDLEEAVKLAKKLTRPHHACVLSPAASSYDHSRTLNIVAMYLESWLLKNEV